jgi:hypothetical protein
MKTTSVAAVLCVFLGAAACDQGGDEGDVEEYGAALTGGSVRASAATRQSVGVYGWQLTKTRSSLGIQGLNADGKVVAAASIRKMSNGAIRLSVQRPGNVTFAINRAGGLRVVGDNSAQATKVVAAMSSDLKGLATPFGNDHPCAWDSAACAIGVTACGVTLNPFACLAAAATCGKAADSCDLIDTMIENCGNGGPYCNANAEGY